MAIVYSGPDVPGGEVSPGSGSTGFTSRSVPFTNTAGQLVSNSSFFFDSTVGSLSLPNSTGVKIDLGTSFNISLPSSAGIGFNGHSAQRLLTLTTAEMQVGTSAAGMKLSLPSVANVTTAVGSSGGAAAPPANPAVYIKILAPGSAGGALTTLYVPAYLSTA